MALAPMLLVAALGAPWLAPFDPAKQSLIEKRAKPGGKFHLGADEFGFATAPLIGCERLVGSSLSAARVMRPMPSSFRPCSTGVSPCSWSNAMRLVCRYAAIPRKTAHVLLRWRCRTAPLP